MAPRTRTTAGLAAAALLLIAAVVGLAASRAGPPARCPDGLIALGARCCGEGQRLDDAGRCAGAPRRCAAGLRVTPAGCVGDSAAIPIAEGTLRLGPGDWEAQGIVQPREVRVPAFALDRLEVTEARYAACIAAGDCAPVALRGEPGLPVTGVTHVDAARYCAFAGGALATRDQLALAAAGPTGRRYPWGDTGAVCRRAAFGLRDGPCGWGATGPDVAGARPDGASPEGVLDLAGNVAEWTSRLDPVTGAEPFMAEVVGGSWSDATATALRGWSRRLVPATARSPDIGFRCAYPPR